MEKLRALLNTCNLDAYLIYDFRGSNYLGRNILQQNKYLNRVIFCKP